MKKKLRNNKKGFTLIEIIVVLVIIGIMIAIAVPAVLGYVNQAKESQALMEGRAGYLGAQTIVINEKAKGVGDTAVTDATIQAEVNDATKMNDAIGEETSTTILPGYTCVVTNKELTGCSFKTKSSGEKWINIVANKEATADNEATYPTN